MVVAVCSSRTSASQADMASANGLLGVGVFRGSSGLKPTGAVSTAVSFSSRSAGLELSRAVCAITMLIAPIVPAKSSRLNIPRSSMTS